MIVLGCKGLIRAFLESPTLTQVGDGDDFNVLVFKPAGP